MAATERLVIHPGRHAGQAHSAFLRALERADISLDDLMPEAAAALWHGYLTAWVDRAYAEGLAREIRRRLENDTHPVTVPEGELVESAIQASLYLHAGATWTTRPCQRQVPSTVDGRLMDCRMSTLKGVDHTMPQALYCPRHGYAVTAQEIPVDGSLFGSTSS